MRKLIYSASCALGLATALGSAQAADLPSHKAPPVYIPPPAFTWTGLYGGINIGYSFGDSARETGGLGYVFQGALVAPPAGSVWSAGQDLHGVVGGGQVGYNYQFNPWLVLGLEADINATDANSHSNAAIGVFDGNGGHLQSALSTKSVDWWGTVRGRLGFTLPSYPNLMVYGTGGFAYGQVTHNVGFGDNFLGAEAYGHGYFDDTKTGWTAGGGIEWSPASFPAWSLKAEYLYVDLGSTNVSSVPLNGGAPAIVGATVPVFTATQSSPTRFHTVRVGLNWHFDPFAPTLVSNGSALPSIKGPPPPAFIDTYQPFQVRLKVAGVIPLNGHGTVYDMGAANPILGAAFGGTVGSLSGLTGPNGVIAGASTNTSSSIIPMLDVAYYLTKNWAIEAICCVAPHHIQGTGTISSDFARAWLFPPSVMAQYHFTNFGAFQPYLGVGVNFTTFWGTRVNNDTWGIPFVPGAPLGGLAALSSFQWATVAPSWGPVGQIGFDYMFNEHWGVNLDFKYIGLHPMVHSTVNSFVAQAPAIGAVFVPVKVSLPINPIVISAGLTYRFGGSVLSPLF